MSAEYSIRVEPDRDLVRIRMAGFFTPADVEVFVRDRAEAHRALRCGPNLHLTLNDVREMKIQPQDAVVAFQAVMAQPEYRSHRLAFLVAPTLARAQLQRALAAREARLFEREADAEAWLFAEESEVRAA